MANFMLHAQELESQRPLSLPSGQRETGTRRSQMLCSRKFCCDAPNMLCLNPMFHANCVGNKSVYFKKTIFHCVFGSVFFLTSDPVQNPNEDLAAGRLL